ncbi:MAG: hypothetical protein GEU79_18340 [Acidimicrobiia bacterium]|nr:hypothetical protein [Acidimicrobiia bacterium]
MNLTDADLVVLDDRVRCHAATYLLLDGRERSLGLIDAIGALSAFRDYGVDQTRMEVMYLVGDLLHNRLVEIGPPGEEPWSGDVPSLLNALHERWDRVRAPADLEEVVAVALTFDGRRRAMQLATARSEMPAQGIVEEMLGWAMEAPVLVQELKFLVDIGMEEDRIGALCELLEVIVGGSLAIWVPTGSRPDSFERDAETAVEILTGGIDALSGWDDLRDRRHLASAGWLVIGDPGTTLMDRRETSAKLDPGLEPGPGWSAPERPLAGPAVPYPSPSRRHVDLAKLGLFAEIVAAGVETHGIDYLPWTLSQLDSTIKGHHMRMTCLSLLGRWQSEGLIRLGTADEGPWEGSAEAIIGRIAAVWSPAVSDGEIVFSLTDEGRTVGSRRDEERGKNPNTDIALDWVVSWAEEHPVDAGEVFWLMDYLFGDDLLHRAVQMVGDGAAKGLIRFAGPHPNHIPPGEPRVDHRRFELACRTVGGQAGGHLSRAGYLVPADGGNEE